MPTNKQNFTDNRLRKLKHDGSKKRLILFDEKQPGLALQITSTGTKTFQFRHWDKTRRQTKILTLGKYPTVSINEARNTATELIAELNRGVDVVEAANAIKKESTLEEIFKIWLEQHAKPHKKSWDEDERRYNLYIKTPLGKKTLSWFTPNKIRQWHHGITKLQKQRAPNGVTISPTTANRALVLLTTIFNQTAPNISNPCRGVSKFKEQSRDRFLNPQELRRFFTALEEPQTPADLKDYLTLSLFTGARRSNVLAIKWKDIDLDRQTWTIPARESKNNEAMTVPLVEQALEVLIRRKTNASSIYVLPSTKSKTGHYVTPTKAWRSLLLRAKLDEVRLHDLRRTLGSYMAINGCNIVAIGKALGHKNQKTTEVYARLSLDPIRDGMSDAVNSMLAMKDLPEKVIHLGEK